MLFATSLLLALHDQSRATYVFTQCLHNIYVCDAPATLRLRLFKHRPSQIINWYISQYPALDLRAIWEDQRTACMQSPRFFHYFYSANGAWASASHHPPPNLRNSGDVLYKSGFESISTKVLSSIVLCLCVSLSSVNLLYEDEVELEQRRNVISRSPTPTCTISLNLVELDYLCHQNTQRRLSKKRSTTTCYYRLLS